MLTVSQGLPANLSVPRPLLRSPIVSEGYFLTDSMEQIGSGVIDSNNEIIVPPDIDVIDQIEIGGVIYTPSPSPNTNQDYVDEDGTPSTTVSPPPGTFWYNPVTRVLTIGGSLLTGQTVYIFRRVVPTLTDRLLSTHPLFASKATGRISYQTRLGQEPNISNVTFECYRSELTALNTLLAPSQATSINGHIYYPVGKTVEEIPYQNIVRVSCGFRSQFRNHPTRSNLDKPVKIKPLIVRGDDLDYYTTSDVAAKAGVPYSGISIKINVPRKVSSSASITLRQLLTSERLQANSCFVRYDGNSVEVLKWTDVTTHTIADSELKNESYPIPSYTGEGFALNGVPLATELNCANLELDIKEDQPGDKLEIKETSDYRYWEPPLTDHGWYFEVFDYSKLRSPGQCFDNGGPTQKKIVTKLLNGFPIEEIEEIYGFAYTSLDTYYWQNNIIADKDQGIVTTWLGGGGNWQLVKTTKKTYSYSNEGFLEKITTTVSELSRIFKESDSLEAINFYANYIRTRGNGDSLQTPKNAKQDYDARYHYLMYHAYGFQSFGLAYTARSPEAIANNEIGNDLYTEISWSAWKTYTTTETRINRKFSDFYKDIQKPDDADQDWVAPRFLEKREFSLDNAVVITDPRSVQKEKRPQLVFGQVSKQYDKIEIVSTKNPERYKTISVNTYQEGEGLKDTTTDRQINYSDGRPPALNRLETFGRAPLIHEDELKPQIKYLVTTTGLTPTNVESETIKFPGCYTLSEAQTALQTYLLQSNLEALTVRVELNHARNFRDGDRVIYRGQVWRVMGTSNEQEITIDGVLRQRSYTVDLGIDYGNIPFLTQEVKI